jgi:hypothetical protein
MTTHWTERHARSYKIGLLFGWFGRILDKILAYRVSSRGHAPLAIRYPLGSIFVSEIRNFLGRIELLYTKFLWAGVSLGPCYERAPSGCLVLCTRTGENTDYTERLQAKFPWATSVDCQMFVETQRRLEESGLASGDRLYIPAQTHSVHCSCQFTGSPNSHTPPGTPPAITSVTRMHAADLAARDYNTIKYPASYRFGEAPKFLAHLAYDARPALLKRLSNEK